MWRRCGMYGFDVSKELFSNIWWLVGCLSRASPPAELELVRTSGITKRGWKTLKWWWWWCGE